MQESETHQIEPELRTGPPRPVRFTASVRRLRLVFAVGLCAFTLVLVTLGVSSLRDMNRLAKEGETAVAVITKKEAVTSGSPKGGGVQYFLHYVYTAKGKTYRRQQKVLSYRFVAVSVADTFTVTYLPAEPKIHRIGPVTPAEVRADIQIRFWSGGLFLAFGLFPWLLFETNFWRQYRLLRFGLTTPAEITENNGHKHTLQYRFVTHQNHEQSGHTNHVPDTAQNLNRPLIILYNPKNPAENAPYITLKNASVRVE